MRIKFIHRLLLWLLVTGIVLGLAKTTSSGEHVECNLMPTIQQFVKCEVYNKWGYGEVEPFKTIVMKESSWNSEAQNPNSTAYGLGQFLDSTWALTDYQKTKDPQIQILAMMQYIEGRYGTPTEALNYHYKNNHY